MAVGRITGPLLKANLLRHGVNLAFETDLLYLDVINGKVGIKTIPDPQYDLDVNGLVKSTTLDVTTQADIATFTINTNTISSSDSTINLEPSGVNPVVYQGKLVTGDLQISTNTIEVTATNSDLNIDTLGTGKVNVNSNMYVNGDLHVTGNLQVDGDASGTITIGDANTDNVEFKADVNSNLVPEVWKLGDAGIGLNLPGDPKWDLGSTTQRWLNAYAKDVTVDSVTSSSLVVNGIDLVLPQGNTIYVATNGNDTNAGNHEHAPFATVKYALGVATSGTTVFIYPGTYTEIFPLTVPAGVSVRGSGIRSVKIVPTTETRYNDAFLLTGQTTIEDLTVADFFSGGNYFTVTAASAGSTTVNVGTAPFAHTYVSGGTVTIGATVYNITNAVYTYTTGVLVLTHTGGTATPGDSVFVSDLTFSCAGPVGSSTRIFPDNGYAFRFAEGFTVSSRSPYVRNCTVLTKGSVTSPSDPLGFDAHDAGRGAYLDGAYASITSNEAGMLFHSATFITPGVDTITTKNGVRVEWLNSFTYYANKGFNLISSNYGLSQQGKTRLRIDNRAGTWTTGNTVTYYDTDGTTVLASGVISNVDGNYINLTGKCVGFETITDRVGKTVYAQGNAKLATAQKKFGTASLVLDGTGDYASITSQPDFEFGTGDFCLEAYIYPTTSGAYRTIFDMRTAATDVAIFLGLTSGNALYCFINGSIVMTGGTGATLNAWSHVAIARSGTSLKMFLNGVQQGSTYTDTNNYSAKPLRIGADWQALYGLTGYVDDVRVSKGVPRYTGTFTAPASALSGDLSTVLLLHFNGANNSTTFLDDGVTLQDLRTSAGGTATLINFADYSDFGAEVRSIGSACVYGNYGFYGDGDGIIAYLISQNFAYVGAGKLSTNDPNDRIAANEVVKLNRAKIYYTSVDNEGNFSVGDAFFVNQKTGDVLFNGQSLSITAPSGVTFTDGVNTTTILPTNIDTGNIRISGNTIESLTGDVNVVAASGAINLQNNTYITGDLDVTGDINLGGNITIGNESTDTITFVAGITSNLVPSNPASYDLGTDALRWNNAFLSRVEIDGLVIDNNSISTTVGNDDLTLTANGTGKILIPNNNVQIDQALTVNGSTTLKGTTVNGDITQTGDVTQTGDYTQTGNTEITGTLTVGSYAQFEEIKIDLNTISTTTSGTDLVLEAAGTGKISIPSDDVYLGQDLTVNGATTIDNATVTNNLTVGSLTTGDISIENNSITTTVTNSNLELSANGTGIVSIPTNNVEIDQSLTVTQDLTVTTGTTYLKDASITGDITQTGDINQTGDFTTSGTVEVTGNITATNSLQVADILISGHTIESTATNTDLALLPNGTGDIVFENIRVTDNTFRSTLTNQDIILEPNGVGSVLIQSDQSLIIPVGTTAERPGTPVNGMIRYNTDLSRYEGYYATYNKWLQLSGVIDEDGNTYITAELTPGANDNVIRFVVNNNLLAYIDSTKLWADRFETNNIAVYDDQITTVASNTDINLTTAGTGGVKIGNLRIRNNTITNTATNAVTEFSEVGSGYVKISGTNGVVIPSGDLSNLPVSPELGMIRFNTFYSYVEVWNGTQWVNSAGTNSGVTLNQATDIGIVSALLFG